MAKKLLSLLKCPVSQNISIQVTDPDTICTCIKQLHQSTELMKDIYDAYSGTVKFGESRLRETDDTLSKMGVMLTNFDSSLNRWGVHLRKDTEQLREKEQRLERLKKEVEFDKKWLLEKREQFPMKLQDDEYQKAMRIQKIRDYREERGLIETRMKNADEQIEKILENIEDAEEKYDGIQKAKGDQKRAHKADLQNLMIEWEESRGKRDILQSVDIQPQTLLSSLTDKDEWRAKDKELSDLRKEHDVLRENVQDQQDRKDILRLRNDELRRRILHNEAVLQSLKEETKEERLGKDSTSHKHEDRHELHRHGKSGASHRHHDKEGASHKHGTSHRHHDHGMSHKHHSHGKPHKDHDPSTPHRHGSRDGSPPRHGNRDGSPPRHTHKDGASHRHDGTAFHRHRGRDLSPPRHGSRDGSPPRHEKRDVSPPRHGHRDTSHRSREGPHGNREGSPPRHEEHFDASTRRESRGFSSNTKNRDSSPPRHGAMDVSPPRQGNRDGPQGTRDRSPPRHENRTSYLENRDEPPASRADSHKDGATHRRGSRVASPKPGIKDGTPHTVEGRDTTSDNRDGGYLKEQLSMSQFSSQTVVEHRSSDEDFTKL